MKWLVDIKVIVIAVGFSVLLSVLVNHFFFTTDGEVWKRTAIENIQIVGKLQEIQIEYRKGVSRLLDDLDNIRYDNFQIDSILTKHGIK